MVLFFYGPNTFMARQKIKELVERFITKQQSDLNLERFDGSDQSLTVERLISAITSLPFLGSGRLIIIEDLLTNKALSEQVIPALAQVPDSTVVILLEAKPDERTKLFKDLKQQAKSHKFAALSPQHLPLWVVKTASELGGSIDTATARLLIERVGSDQWRLYHELIKLVNFDPQVTAESVELLVEPLFQNTIFDLVEAVLTGRLAEAYRIYSGLRANQAQPLYILSMISWGLRNLVIATAATAAGCQPPQIARDFGMSPYVVQKSISAARRVDLAQLKRAHSLLTATDYRLKTSAGDPDLLIEQLINDIALSLKGTPA